MMKRKKGGIFDNDDESDEFVLTVDKNDKAKEEIKKDKDKEEIKKVKEEIKDEEDIVSEEEPKKEEEKTDNEKKVKKEEKKSKSKKSKKHHKKGKHKRKHHHKGKDKKKNEVETATPPPNIPGGIKLPSLPNPDMRPTFPEEDDPFWDEPVPNVIPALPTTEKKKITLDLDDEFSDDIEKDKKQNKVPSITNKTTTRSLLEDSSETDEIVPKKIVGIALPGLNTPPTLNKDEKSDEDLDLEKDNFETKNPEPKKVMIMGVPLPGFGLPPTPKISLLNKDKSSDDEWDKDDDENKEVAEPKKSYF